MDKESFGMTTGAFKVPEVAALRSSSPDVVRVCTLKSIAADVLLEGKERSQATADRVLAEGKERSSVQGASLPRRETIWA
jgi:hypothetical protein